MSIDASLLRRLTASRWLIPILARMHIEPGSRFGVLVRRLGVSRSMLAASLDTLEREGWIIRNPGHGHPLRPEYLLTTDGRVAAAWAADATAVLSGLGLRRWSLPTLSAIVAGKARFNDLAVALSPISPRALSMALDQLAEIGLVEKLEEPSRHPRYIPYETGATLASKLNLAVTDS